ncbi:MAG: M20/M25/M40 family metallo-hydrolase [Phenylobacterium sp.]|uniref:M20/M25/M40 family metallo-hydrolase n=1 Tax=Phenylobacterium sp. TaxID=1871053 RepID=UPI001A57C34B|nr:M20/M25/M40 family metallo-hydrolase [Phenylobacterium sp.]MBL8769895.1 M20/M25/M40 family metallo-hydrolase [Phenylobacterium sp.]
MKLVLAAALAAALAAPALAAPPKPDPALLDRTLEILKRGVAFPTVAGRGQTVAYAEYLKSVLVAGGYRPDEITIEPLNGTAFLIARYPGTDPKRPPIVISGHMDVVEARAEDWARDPFTPVVEGGYLYGRGADDNKADVSVVVATLAKLRKEGWKPGRDVVLALSGDEETTMVTTAELARRLKGAEMVLNADGGGGSLDEAGKAVAYGVQGAEKTYADFTITFTDPGGHSSRPTPSNAIYRLSAALEKLRAYRFPTMHNEITRAMLEAASRSTPGDLGAAMKRFAADPADKDAVERLSADANYNPVLRTTCVATMLSGGHAPNALPQKASATVNCRIFPGTSSESVRRTLAEVIGDASVTVTRVDDGSVDSPASPLRPDVMTAIRKAVHARFPGLPIVPSQASGATDSMHFRAVGIPSYGVSGLFMRPGEAFAHGLNEKVPIAALDGSLAHWDSILRDLAK